MSLPHSSDSSPSNSPELATQPSRKRQRSLSMQSDSAASSSSVKRSAAENPSNDITIRSPRTDHLSSLNPNNQDIDAYMAEQGEADIPTFMSPPPSQIISSPHMSLSREEKLELVDNGKGRRMQIGETWYLVARDWYKRWHKAVTGEIDKEGPVTEQDLGPVNNSSLLDEHGNLKPSLAEGVDVEYVPQEVWDSFTDWYGPSTQPLPRRVIARGAAKLPAIEFHPLRLKVFRLVKSSADQSSTPHEWLTISAGETISRLCTDLASKVAPDTEIRPYRVWTPGMSFEDVAEVEICGSQLLTSDAKIVEESDKTLEEEGVELDDPFIVEFKQPDGWIVELPKPVQTITTFEPRPLFNSSDGFFNKMSTNHVSATPSVSLYKPTGIYNSFKTTSTALALANKSITKTLESGTLGLGNMGNTCFMNSALQCLAHLKELLDYFLTGVYEDELNRDNPLGMGGAIAEAFGALLNRIWTSSGSSTSFSPREFKSQLQRFAPQFSGYQQHDSQEFVAFLLDGLHEDLNRVLKKPYVEKPDWEGGGNLELVQLAQKSWEGYMMRNDSVIVDLFQGQYQSTLVCPECQKVSITFDPFMYLTLPLPVQKKWKHNIYYIPWDLEKPHVKVPVEINRDSSFKDLRAILGRWMGAPPENLLTLEIFNHRFYKNLNDNLPVGDMSDGDTIVCFELPCNARQNRAYKKNPNDPFIVPVYLSDAKPAFRSTYASSRPSPILFGYPMVVAIDREQATDKNTMYEFVATRLQRWTAHARDLYTWEVGDRSHIEQVPIQVNGFSPRDSLTEIAEDGSVKTIEMTPPPEGDVAERDIVDEKTMAVDEKPSALGEADDAEPRNVGVKKDIFNLRVQINHKDFGTGYNMYASTANYELWEDRLEEIDDKDPVLLKEDDVLFCEFDEDKKAYYFGDGQRHEHALWDQWETFTHPELEESRKASAEKRHKGITLEDCLDEFTKEEQLGEDDLWYCPRCKKHQQATKKFDLWKAPDVLVVHLKRFSNSRTLRDKIDAHVDFPIEGLDLSDRIGERRTARKLREEGVDVQELKLGNLDEPLVYDLFGVDEHIGGLGGGHYRAYAYHHLTDKWYHFDDSYVTPARASDSVNANAYLLFYRRRTKAPLGGKSSLKVLDAKLQPKPEVRIEPVSASIGSMDAHLPTPPNEPADFIHSDRLPFFSSDLRLESSDSWNLRSGGSNAGSSVPSPPTDDARDFDDYHQSMSYSGPLALATQRFAFPDPASKASPTSSNEADVDLDIDLDTEDWDSAHEKYRVSVREVSSGNGRSPDWDPVSNRASPSYSEVSDLDPFSDVNIQKSKDDEPIDADDGRDGAI
ncbi:hypothetical protein CPB84DRAFT_1844494 [Gymnopilus junonius]|uniref:ubiquitinyl hydrolase 1 n=1 Tax=Gymnopilus junonius TaxID=109634 RepID=A0A9P5NV43_GYMJU|nr:hypothetical protein CPB84DRAFT_1844494 [Gymnopilus junonius]